MLDFWRGFKSRGAQKAFSCLLIKRRTKNMNGLSMVAYDDKMLSLKRDNAMIIKASSDLRNDYASISKMAKESGEPIYITLNGEGDGVFMDIKAFEKLTQLLEIERDLLRSEQEIASGAPLKSAEEVAASYGIHKK
jgi:PHD/YefM family antitoxin component YafN of YafNO toxin-antitoxin module